MARDLTSNRTPWPAMNDYLDELESVLTRWPWSRRRLLTELTDGLTDAVAHYRHGGASTGEAVERAVRDSGPAETVARAMAEVLSVGSARRTALALLLSGPAIGVLWLQFLVPGQLPPALLRSHPIVGVLIVLSAGCAAATVLAARRAVGPLRWVPTRTAAAACAAAATGDVVLLGLAVLTLTGSQVSPVAAAAIAASLVRLTLAQRVARRNLRSSVSR